jgi:tetratricopeptide (TPR) repeat protein
LPFWYLLLVSLLLPAFSLAAQPVHPLLQTEGSNSDGDLTKQLGELVRQKRWQEAAELGKALTAKHPDDQGLQYWLGVACWRLQDPIDAIKALRSAERLGMDTANLHMVLGLAYYDFHQFVLFEAQMEKAAKLDPQNFEPLYTLGRYFEANKGDFTGALGLLDKALQLNPDHTMTLYNRGYCLEMLGRRDEAMETFRRAIDLIEKNIEAFSLPYQGMARLLLDSDPNGALWFAQRAVQVEPNVDSNHATLSKVYERLGKLSPAVQELQAAVRLSPNKSSLHYVLFRLLNKLGDENAAQEELNTFNELNAIYGQH